MKSPFLLVLIAFLSLSNASFACCGKASTTFSTSIGQKACQTVFSFINLDLSLLSPKASIADFNVAGPQTTCCPKKASSPIEDTQNATIQTPNEQKSMATEKGTQEAMLPALRGMQYEIIPVVNKQESTKMEDKQIIPIANVQEPKQPSINAQSNKSLFRIDLLRRFKIQIL